MFGSKTQPLHKLKYGKWRRREQCWQYMLFVRIIKGTTTSWGHVRVSGPYCQVPETKATSPFFSHTGLHNKIFKIIYKNMIKIFSHWRLSFPVKHLWTCCRNEYKITDSATAREDFDNEGRQINKTMYILQQLIISQIKKLNRVPARCRANLSTLGNRSNGLTFQDGFRSMYSSV